MPPLAVPTIQRRIPGPSSPLHHGVVTCSAGHGPCTQQLRAAAVAGTMRPFTQADPGGAHPNTQSAHHAPAPSTPAQHQQHKLRHIIQALSLL
jgi:hypothetical protein